MMKNYLAQINVRHASAAVMLTALCATACTDKPTPPIKTSTPPEVRLGGGLSPPWSTNGVEPKEPVKDVAPKPSNAKSDMSKAEESRSMPMPGQANDHSVLEPPAAQKPPATKP